MAKRSISLGTYNPVSGELVQLHKERIDEWVSKGAIVTDAVKKIQKMHKKGAPVTAQTLKTQASNQPAQEEQTGKGAEMGASDKKSKKTESSAKNAEPSKQKRAATETSAESVEQPMNKQLNPKQQLNK